MSEHHAGESNPDPRDAGARREGASASPLDTVAPDSAPPTESTVRIGLVLPDEVEVELVVAELEVRLEPLDVLRRLVAHEDRAAHLLGAGLYRPPP